MKYMRSMFVALIMTVVASVSWANPYEVTTSNNSDILGGVERVDIIIAELAMSESANAGGAIIYDRARIDQQNAQLDKYMAYVNGQTGKVDLPHTHPMVYDIRYVSNTLDVEVRSKGMRDLLRLYLQMMEQLNRSQSSNMSNGIIPWDYERYRLIRAKIETFLVDYIDQTDPQDLPQYGEYPQADFAPAGVTLQVLAEDRERLGPLAVPKRVPTPAVQPAAR